MQEPRASRRFLAAAVLAIIIAIPPFSVPALAATPPAESEAALPSTLNFPVGGGWSENNVSVERNAHIRDARLVMNGGTIPTPATYRLNATSQAAGRANAWSGGLPLDAPEEPPEAYIAMAFNATQVANVSARDGALAKTGIVMNFTYQLYIFQVNALDIIELDVLWVGYGLPPSMPIFYNGKIFLYNFTSLAWDDVATYPFPSTGVRDVGFNATAPANYIKPGTGSVAAMVVSEATSAEVFTDVFEITVVTGVYPRPAVDVGNDGNIDWRWDAPGWGALGRQQEFEDGLETSLDMFAPGGGTVESTFMIPAGSSIVSASAILSRSPGYGWTNRTGSNETATGSGTTNLTLSGFASNADGNAAYVNLSSLLAEDRLTESNTPPQNGSLVVGSDPNGYRSAGQWLTFSTAGILSRISVRIITIEGNPGNLRLDVEGVNTTGFPDGVVRASSWINQTAIANNSWISFGFGNVSIAAGTNLSLVVRAPFAPPDTTTNYVTLAMTGNNSWALGESLSYFNVTSLGSSWTHVLNADMMFEIRMNIPLLSSDAPNVKVNGVSGIFTTAGGLPFLRYELGAFEISAFSYNFSVTNSNGFTIRFNWTVDVQYVLLAEGLRLSVANASATNHTLAPGELARFLDLRDDVGLATISSTDYVLGPATEFLVRLRFELSATSDGGVELSSLDIRYTLNLTSGDLSPRFDSYLWATPASEPRASIPIRIYSPGASSLTLLEAAITYDRPPVYFGFSSTVTDEDVELVADLNTVFHDDYDNANLSFQFSVLSGDTTAFVALRGYNLTITPYANVSGLVVVNVTARDSWGLANWSGDVTFTIVTVNDPPWLSISLLNVTWGGIETADLTPYLFDAESPTSTISITAASGTSLTFSGRSLIFNFSVGAGDVDLFVTVSDGVAEAAWPLRVHPRESNTPPSLEPINTVLMADNAAYWLDLGLYASDVEDDLSELQFQLSVGLSEQSPVLWTVVTNATSSYLKLIPRAPAGTRVTAALTVIDTDGNTNQTPLAINIVGPANAPPRIVGIDPAISLTTDSVFVFLATKYSDPEDRDPARLTWSVANDNPELFTAEIDASTQTLVLTPVAGASGIGSITLRVVDSAGSEATKTITVSVRAPVQPSSFSILAVGLFFAGVVLLTAIIVRRGRHRRKRPTTKPLGGMKAQEPGSGAALVAVEGAKEEESVELPSAEARAGGAATEDVGSFLRGLTESPSDKPPSPEEGYVALGLKSGLDSTAAPIATPVPAAAPGAKPPAHLAELYVFSIKDGGLLFQVPPTGLALLPQVDENEFLQWAFDTVRKVEKTPEVARVLDWKEWKVVLARGNAFFLAGRVRGEDFEALAREVKTLVQEVDHNFPGSALDWQRTEVVETVGDVLRRLVK